MCLQSTFKHIRHAEQIAFNSQIISLFIRHVVEKYNVLFIIIIDLHFDRNITYNLTSYWCAQREMDLRRLWSPYLQERRMACFLFGF